MNSPLAPEIEAAGLRAHPAGAPATRLPAGLIVVLAALFLAVWLAPPLQFLKPLGTVFPLWLHNVTETAAIAVAALVFAVCWHSQHDEASGNVLLLGCGFLGVALLDLGHTLSYRGMPDFITPSHPEKAINLWLAARYLAALTLLAVALRTWPPIRGGLARALLATAAVSLAGGVILLELLAHDRWPRTFIDGSGLTAFKIGAEYGIVALLAVAAVGFHRHTSRADRYDAHDLRTAALITVLSELCFTLYSNVNDVFQLLGHAYKIVAYLYIYRAVFVTAVREPYRRLEVEIDERRVAEQRVEYLAFHDPLTQLPNRVLARDRVDRAIAEARRDRRQVALLYLDLDHFKNVNDSLGHGAGDRLLRTVAARLLAALRETDTVCRQGGDEFLVVLGGQGERHRVEAVVAKLMAALALPIELDGHEVACSASIGVARYPQDGEDFDALLQKADIALYRAKDAGRSTFRFFDEQMNAEAMEQLRLRNGLAQALERGELALHYQPQIDLASGRVVGAEALLRWQRPGLGSVPPARFIPVAEESGLIVPIGTWVIEQACRQLAAWRAQGLAPLRVAVNLSALQFRRGDIAAVVARALADSGIEPGLLELELTESMLLQDSEHVVAAVAALKALGLRLSIDDFGTGYSSLAYLKRLAVDQLKIDRSFVADLARQDDDAIVRAIIQMARSLGLQTVAEGVEEEPVRARLQAHGCDLAQGFLFAPALPAVEFAAFVARFDAQAAEAA